MDLMTIFAASGLSVAAGQRAMLAAFALGAVHHTEYFELSSRFLWLASTPVLVVLGVLALIELLADWFPEVSELTEVAAVAPRVVVGFLSAAAMAGTVDDSLTALAGSGVLGVGAALTTHSAMQRFRRATRDIDDTADHAASAATTLTATGLTASAFVAPALVVPVLIGAVLVFGAVLLVFGFVRRSVVRAAGLDEDDAAAPGASASSDP